MRSSVNVDEIDELWRTWVEEIEVVAEKELGIWDVKEEEGKRKRSEQREERWRQNMVQWKNELRRRRDRTRGVERTEVQIRYREVRGELKRRWRRREVVKSKVNEDLERLESRDPRLYWNRLKALVGVRAKSKLPRRMKEGDGWASEERSMELWVEELGGDEQGEPEVGIFLSRGVTEIKELDQPITPGEIERVLKRVRRGRAAGEDGLFGEMLKYGGDLIILSLERVFNKIFEAGTVPKAWRRGLIVPVFKAGDKERVGNYRGITLLGVVAKVFAQILHSRLSSFLEGRQLLEPEQAGFRRGRSTVEHVLSLSELLDKRTRAGSPTYCCFMDIRKAYDTVWREGMWRRLEETGVSQKMMKMLWGWYTGVESCVLVNGRRSKWFPVEQGVRQGCVLSPLLFLVFINGLIREIREEGLGVRVGEVRVCSLFFADDLVLVAEEAGHLQHLMEVAVGYGQRWRFQYNPGKCKVMVYGKGGEEKFDVGGVRIERVDRFKYLGVWFDENLNWKVHKELVLDKARRKAYMMFGFGMRRGLSVRGALKLWRCIRPIFEYGAEVWGGGGMGRGREVTK